MSKAILMNSLTFYLKVLKLCLLRQGVFSILYTMVGVLTEGFFDVIIKVKNSKYKK